MDLEGRPGENGGILQWPGECQVRCPEVFCCVRVVRVIEVTRIDEPNYSSVQLALTGHD